MVHPCTPLADDYVVRKKKRHAPRGRNKNVGTRLNSRVKRRSHDMKSWNLPKFWKTVQTQRRKGRMAWGSIALLYWYNWENCAMIRTHVHVPQESA
jgi:hypothetical protein